MLRHPQVVTHDGLATHLSEKLLARVLITATATLSVILPFVLLFGAIVSLAATKNQYALLGLLCSWTLIFAGCVSVFSGAKVDTIFATTAAYAAVLVVFVGGNMGANTSRASPV
jgi:hypothetical protein